MDYNSQLDLANQSHIASSAQNVRYDSKRALQTQQVRDLCKDEIYPQLFRGRPYLLEEVDKSQEVSHKYLDRALHVDLIAHVSTEQISSKCDKWLMEKLAKGHIKEDKNVQASMPTLKDLKFIQDRAHLYKPWEKDRFVTISAGYPQRGISGEFHTLDILSFLVWMFHNESLTEVVDWIVVENPARIRDLHRTAGLNMEPDEAWDSKKSFFRVKISELEKYGLITARKGYLLH